MNNKIKGFLILITAIVSLNAYTNVSTDKSSKQQIIQKEIVAHNEIKRGQEVWLTYPRFQILYKEGKIPITKPVLFLIGSEKCPYTKKMISYFIKDPKFQTLLSQYTLVYFEANQYTLPDNMFVNILPTIYFLHPKTLKQITPGPMIGYVKPQKAYNYLVGLLKAYKTYIHKKYPNLDNN